MAKFQPRRVVKKALATKLPGRAGAGEPPPDPESLMGAQVEAPARGQQGYELASGRVIYPPGWGLPDEAEPVLVRRDDAEYRTYDPLEDETGLFLTLADTEPTAEGCLAFANCYGLLGESATYQLREAARKEGEPRPLDVYRGEPLRVWKAAVLWLRYLTRLWRLAADEDAQGLAEFVRWAGVEAPYVVFDGIPPERFEAPLPPALRRPGPQPRRGDLTVNTGRILPFDLPAQLRGLLAPGDLVTPALLLCAQAINDALRGNVEYRMVWHLGQNRPVSREAPSGLWGAVCLQFSAAVDGRRQYHRCPVCRRWFGVGIGGGRSHKVFCTDSCRVQNTLLRREKARELHAGGKTAKQIAQELGTEERTVKGWVKGTRGK